MAGSSPAMTTEKTALNLRQRLQTLEGQALGIPDTGEIEPVNEGRDHITVAIGQRNHGINGNSLGVHGLPHAASNPRPRHSRFHRLIRR
jgi:hypothetical protein